MPGIASRAVDVDGVRWALVEYEPGVLREEFCDVGHSGYVLRGEVTYEFADGGEPLRVRAGDGLVLPGAREHRGPRRRRGRDAVPDRLGGRARRLTPQAHPSRRSRR